MTENGPEEAWRSLKGPGIPEGTQLDEVTGNIRFTDEGPNDEGLSGDPEPRNPRIPPAAGAAAVEMAEAVQKD